jgi:hypothetical protein
MLKVLTLHVALSASDKSAKSPAHAPFGTFVTEIPA